MQLGPGKALRHPPSIRYEAVSAAPHFPGRRAGEAEGPCCTLHLRYCYLFAIFEEMRDHTYLGEFELMILLTIIRLEDEVYGVPLARELSIIRGGDVAVGSVYAALDRLELKGLIASSLGDPSPERGGRAKRYFRVTEQGLQAVRETRRVLNKLWKSLPATRGDVA
jgi:PadR family transcriptional regulator, regulatory protein PadR